MLVWNESTPDSCLGIYLIRDRTWVGRGMRPSKNSIHGGAACLWYQTSQLQLQGLCYSLAGRLQAYHSNFSDLARLHRSRDNSTDLMELSCRPTWSLGQERAVACSLSPSRCTPTLPFLHCAGLAHHSWGEESSLLSSVQIP